MSNYQNSLDSQHAIETLVWYSLRISLKSRRTIGNQTPVLKILQSTLKHISVDSDGDSERPAIKRAFHVPEVYGHCLKYRTGTVFPLEILFFGVDEHAVATWLEAFRLYLSASPQANFDLIDIQDITKHSGAELITADNCSTAELELFTPLPFKRSPQARQTDLTLKVFLEGLQRRVKSLFGVQLPLPDAQNIRLQTTYWRYVQLPTRPANYAKRAKTVEAPNGNNSGTTAVSTQYYNGCIGPLYFVGDLAPIMPWLRLAEAIHAGGDVALNPLGYGRLHVPANPRFDTRLKHQSIWLAALEKVQQRHDDWAAGLVAECGTPSGAWKSCRFGS